MPFLLFFVFALFGAFHADGDNPLLDFFEVAVVFDHSENEDRQNSKAGHTQKYHREPYATSWSICDLDGLLSNSIGNVPKHFHKALWVYAGDRKSLGEILYNIVVHSAQVVIKPDLIGPVQSEFATNRLFTYLVGYDILTHE